MPSDLPLLPADLPADLSAVALAEAEALAKAEPKPGRYRHYKGNDYRVIGLARHSETREPLVVYQALYGERGLWVRPVAMFTEEIELGGKRVARFARVASE
jgi:hypothetical protein